MQWPRRRHRSRSRDHPNPVRRPLRRPTRASAHDSSSGAGTAHNLRRRAHRALQSIPPPAAAAPAPTAQSLGLPIYPAAQYLATYDAGSGQKYVLFGTTAGFAEIVSYYKSQLKEGGELVFREPATHTWDVGRFREETMVFPPGVTVKDFTWGGSKGYPNPRLNGQPERFPTIIMLVPQPPAAAPAARQ